MALLRSALDRVLRTRFGRGSTTASEFGERAPPSVAAGPRWVFRGSHICPALRSRLSALDVPLALGSQLSPPLPRFTRFHIAPLSTLFAGSHQQQKALQSANHRRHRIRWSIEMRPHLHSTFRPVSGVDPVDVDPVDVDHPLTPMIH